MAAEPKVPALRAFKGLELSSVLTKKVPMIEATTPPAEITIGSKIPPIPRVATPTIPKVIAAMIEPT